MGGYRFVAYGSMVTATHFTHCFLQTQLALHRNIPSNTVSLPEQRCVKRAIIWPLLWTSVITIMLTLLRLLKRGLIIQYCIYGIPYVSFNGQTRRTATPMAIRAVSTHTKTAKKGRRYDSHGFQNRLESIEFVKIHQARCGTLRTFP